MLCVSVCFCGCYYTVCFSVLRIHANLKQARAHTQILYMYKWRELEKQRDTLLLAHNTQDLFGLRVRLRLCKQPVAITCPPQFTFVLSPTRFLSFDLSDWILGQ